MTLATVCWLTPSHGKVTPGKVTPGKVTPGKVTPGKVTGDPIVNHGFRSFLSGSSFPKAYYA